MYILQDAQMSNRINVPMLSIIIVPIHQGPSSILGLDKRPPFCRRQLEATATSDLTFSFHSFFSNIILTCVFYVIYVGKIMIRMYV